MLTYRSGVGTASNAQRNGTLTVDVSPGLFSILQFVEVYVGIWGGKSVHALVVDQSSCFGYENQTVYSRQFNFLKTMT